jgi:hypothetical protein
VVVDQTQWHLGFSLTVSMPKSIASTLERREKRRLRGTNFHAYQVMVYQNVLLTFLEKFLLCFVCMNFEASCHHSLTEEQEKCNFFSNTGTMD